MGWLLAAAAVVIMAWFSRRLHDQAAEHAAIGLHRSPLYWAACLLTCLLLGLSIFMAHVHSHGPIPTWMWIAVVVLIVPILLLRRALKWRYPI
jgi:ABC-type dipeptide/oligopeptide/nickel transport system permease component